jgi:hypothetical protein
VKRGLHQKASLTTAAASPGSRKQHEQQRY